eukprot:3786087-Prymnesium_polylepis.1
MAEYSGLSSLSTLKFEYCISRVRVAAESRSARARSWLDVGGDWVCCGIPLRSTVSLAHAWNSLKDSVPSVFRSARLNSSSSSSINLSEASFFTCSGSASTTALCVASSAAATCCAKASALLVDTRRPSAGNEPARATRRAAISMCGCSSGRNTFRTLSHCSFRAVYSLSA